MRHDVEGLVCNICKNKLGITTSVESDIIYHNFNMKTDVFYGTGEKIHETLFYLLSHTGGGGMKNIRERLDEGLDLKKLYNFKATPQTKFSFGETVSDRNYKLNVINLYNSGFTTSLFKNDSDEVVLSDKSLKDYFSKGMVDWMNGRQKNSEMQKSISRLTGGLEPKDMPFSEFLEYLARLVDYNTKLSKHPLFSPRTLTGNQNMLVEKLKKGGHFSQKRAKRTKNLTGRSANLQWEGIRKACKFGTEYFTKGGTIHYMLDDMDMSMILEKTLHKGKMPICTSEIRYIFRNWHVFKTRIQFYRDHVKCEAPWYDPKQPLKQCKGWVKLALDMTNKRMRSTAVAIAMPYTKLKRIRAMRRQLQDLNFGPVRGGTTYKTLALRALKEFHDVEIAAYTQRFMYEL